MSNEAGNRAQFFWTTKASPRFAEQNRVDFAIRADGQFHRYRLALGKHPAWAKQVITALRVDPGEWDHQSTQSAAFAIDYIRARRAN